LAGLALAITAASAGCAASPPAAAPAASHPASPAATPSAAASGASNQGASALLAILPSIVGCLQANGVSVTATATAKEVRKAFVAMPVASQLQVFTACEHLFPAAVRQEIQNDLTHEQGFFGVPVSAGASSAGAGSPAAGDGQ
jgi:hypothetical protein